MASPPSPDTAAAIKEEDGEDSGVSSLISSDQELRNKFLHDVQRLVELRNRLRAPASGAQPLLPPQPKPVRHNP
jgi:hypothetical protein